MAVIAAVHAPPQSAFAALDRIMLLNEGRLVWSGRGADAGVALQAAGRPCPPGVSVAEFILSAEGRAALELVAGSPATYQAAAGAGPSYGAGPGDGKMTDVELEPRSGPPGLSTLVSLSPNGIISSPQGLDGLRLTPADDAEVPTSSRMHMLSSADSADGPGAEGRSLGGSRKHSSRAPSPLAGGPLQIEPPPWGEASAGGRQRQRAAARKCCAPCQSQCSGAVARAASELGVELFVLTRRAARQTLRKPALLALHAALAAGVGLLLGGLYYKQSLSLAGWQNRAGAFFFVNAFFGLASLSTIEMFLLDRIAAGREMRGGCYEPSSYFFSKLVVDALCLRVFPGILFFVPFYFMMGLKTEADAPGETGPRPRHPTVSCHEARSVEPDASYRSESRSRRGSKWGTLVPAVRGAITYT